MDKPVNFECIPCFKIAAVLAFTR